jgi:glycosidase
MKAIQYTFLLIILCALSIVWYFHFADDRIAHTFRYDNRNHSILINQLCLAGDFNGYRDGMHPLKDDNEDDIWETEICLDPGWHEYRFILNKGERWLRDPQNTCYGGQNSNSLVYVNKIQPPIFKAIFPASGSWLYKNPGDGYINLSASMSSYPELEFRFYINSRPILLTEKDSLYFFTFAPETEGEHGWEFRIEEKNGQLIHRRQGFWQINYHNQKPIADAGFTKFTIPNKGVGLNGGLSQDPDFEPLTKFRWSILNDLSGEFEIINPDMPFPQFRATKPGTYQIELTVWDSLGASASDITEVVVLNARDETVRFEYNPALYKDPVKRVGLVGEFNQWKSGIDTLCYDPQNQIWNTNLQLKNGMYEYKYVINNKSWIVDPDNQNRIEDGWNGYNSLKRVDHNLTVSFDSNPEKLSETANDIVFRIDNQRNEAVSIRWYGDIQNPDEKWSGKGEMLRFEKRNSPGNYYFYAIAEKDGRFADPVILQVNHFDKTWCGRFDESPAWVDTSVIYEIFLRKYQSPGSFRKLLGELDNLKDLGIDALWLMPVTDGPTEHGYAPTNLFDAEEDYGTLQEYQQLIDSAHKRGMRIIFDYIANHISDQHRFVREAFENPQSPLRQWFYWNEDGGWGYHNDWDNLVNLNYNSTMVYNYMLDVARFWASLGVDGLRCDVAWAVPHSFWKVFRRELKKLNPDILLINEVLPRQQAFHDFEFDMSYDTDLYGNMLDVLRGKKPLSALEYIIRKASANYPSSARHLRYIENHDLPRFISQFSRRQTEVMAALLFTLPGTPLIYYGQEEFVREMRPELHPKHALEQFDFYKSLIKLRHSSKAITKGEINTIALDNNIKIWQFRRQFGGEELDVLINLSKVRQKINLPENQTIILSNSKTDRFSSEIDGESFMILKKESK